MFLNLDIKLKVRTLIREKSFEKRYTAIFSLLTTIILIKINLYGEFYKYKNVLNSFIQSNIFTNIGLIGVLVSALSITLSSFGAENIRKLKVILNSNKNELDTLIQDYIFISVVIGFVVGFKLILLILLNSRLALMRNIILFYIIIYIYIILFYYIIFSLISIVNHTYDIFNIIQFISSYSKDEIEILEKYNKKLNSVEAEIKKNIKKMDLELSHEDYMEIVKIVIQRDYNDLSEGMIKQLESKYKYCKPIFKEKT